MALRHKLRDDNVRKAWTGPAARRFVGSGDPRVGSLSLMRSPDQRTALLF